MAKAKPTPRALASGRGDKLDWHRFNLLENLMIFRAVSSRVVLDEHASFCITPLDRDRSVCLIYAVDHRTDPLIKVTDGPRPDYVVFYVSKTACICTIIELKGSEPKGLRHGIKQIKAFRDRLQRELRTHLSPSVARAMHFQGILLTPMVAQMPGALIDAEAEKGFVILPLKYDHQAELAPYVSRRLDTSDRYRHTQHRHISREFNYIEQILVDCPLPERWAALEQHDPGIAISYARPDGKPTAFASLVATPTLAEATFDTDDYYTRVKHELTRLAIPTGKLTFRVLG